MPQIVNAESTSWTQEEKEIAIAVLQKMGRSQEAPSGLPVDVFEPFLDIKKNNSTEGVIFNAEGAVFLVQRPSRKKNPKEPFPELWHSPGVTHGKTERLADTLTRLVQRELGNAGIRRIAEVWPPAEVIEPPRMGIYLLRIFAIGLAGAPQNKRGGFYSEADIDEMFDKLVPCHRDIIIPRARELRARLIESGLWF